MPAPSPLASVRLASATVPATLVARSIPMSCQQSIRRLHKTRDCQACYQPCKPARDQRTWRCAAKSPNGSSCNGANPSFRVTLDTDEAKVSLRFAEVEQKQEGGNAIIIETVTAGSIAEQEGIRARQKVLAISSPMNGAEMWPLNNRPSLRFVREAVTTLRRSDTVILDLTTEPLAEEQLQAVESVASSGAFQSKLFDSVQAPESTSEEGQEAKEVTIADKLQKQWEADEQQAAREQSARQRRIQRRKDYMERDSARNDTPLILGLLAAFLLPSIIILGIAFSSGYLDKLGGGYNSY